MPQFKAPTRDLKFVLHDVLKVSDLYQTLPDFQEATPDIIDAVLDQAAKFCEDVLAPLNESGDKEGCTWTEQGVKTPAGFADAYAQYVEGGVALASGRSAVWRAGYAQRLGSLHE